MNPYAKIVMAVLFIQAISLFLVITYTYYTTQQVSVGLVMLFILSTVELAVVDEYLVHRKFIKRKV